jgi:biopolymer transport protein ExbD
MRTIVVAIALIGATACTRADKEDKKSAPAPAPEVEPTPGPGTSTRDPAATLPMAGGSSCTLPAVVIQRAGAWVGDANGGRFASSCKGEPDVAAIATALCDWAAANPGCGGLEIAAAGGVSYQQVVSVMDAAIRIGRTDIGVSDKPQASFPAKATAAQQLPASCGAPVKACAAPAATKPPIVVMAPGPATSKARVPTGPGDLSGADLADVPVLIIAPDATISLDGHKLAGSDPVAALDQSLRAHAPATSPAARGLLVLQADKATDAALLNRVMRTARDAGYDNILFAVKRD